MYFAKCGTRLPDVASFCAQCGTPQLPLPGQARLRRLWPWFLLASVIDLALLFVGLRPTFVVAVTGLRFTDWSWTIGFLLFIVLTLGWLWLLLRTMWRWLRK